MIDVKSQKPELQSLPQAEWGEIGWWDSLLILPTYEEHDSGYAHIAIIGCRYIDDKELAVKIIAQPDDITWPSNDGDWETRVRTDAFWENGVLHLWSNYNEFSIDSQTSSVEILMRKSIKGENK